jgi:hypothetical protein
MEPKLKWTVMVYMVADTGDSFYQSAMKNIGEMTAAKFEDDVKVVVHADAPSPWLTKCWEVTGTSDGKKGEASEVSNADTGCGHKCLLEFVEKCIRNPNYQAQNYLLVLWGHGEGIDWKDKILANRTGQTITGVGKRFAPGSEGVLQVGELGKILKELNLGEAKIKKENVVLGFDACLMGMIEVYDEIQEYVGYAVAANDEIPDTGWPYTDILNLLGGKEIEPKILAAKIVDVCKEWYSFKSPESQVSFSACNLTQSKALRIAARQLITVLTEGINENLVREAIRKARDFAEDLKEKAYVDFYAFCSELKEQARLGDGLQKLLDPAEEVDNALKNFVFNHGFSDEYPYKYYRESRALSICFPESAALVGSVRGIEVNWGSYKDLNFCRETNWPRLLQEFWDRGRAQ